MRIPNTDSALKALQEGAEGPKTGPEPPKSVRYANSF